MQAPRIQQVSEDSLFFCWPASNEVPTPQSARLFGRVAQQLIHSHPQTILNVVPSYQSILVQFDMQRTQAKEVQNTVLEQIDAALETESEQASNQHRIPVFYDSRVADDLLDLCKAKDCSPEHLVEQHTAQSYTVYAIGFQPGFAYLGYVPEALATPRKASFKAQVPAGSVGIADRQTAVYPTESPGGWNVIGRTPSAMVEGVESRLMTGDQVQFYSIGEQQYRELGGEL